MKTVTLIPFLLVALLFSSCSTYQYVALDPVEPESSEESKLSLKDSLEINYSFEGNGGEIQVEIFNRSLRPLLVDKTKSTLIKDGETFPFLDNTSQVSSSSYSRQSNLDERDYYTTTNGEIRTDPSILFIPPDSKVQMNGPVLERSFFDFPEGKPVTAMDLRTDNGYYKTQSVSFSKEESPSTYRVFLTIIPYGEEESPVFLEQQFRIGKLTSTSLSPGYFDKDGGNRFFIEEPTGMGTFMGGVAALALLVVLAAAGGL